MHPYSVFFHAEAVVVEYAGFMLASYCISATVRIKKKSCTIFANYCKLMGLSAVFTVFFALAVK